MGGGTTWYKGGTEEEEGRTGVRSIMSPGRRREKEIFKREGGPPKR